MQRNLKNKKTPNTSKGITLVALVITIIVLLILAGVAINMAINSDGLFGKANEATEKWNESVEKEETAITNLLDIAENIGLPEGWEGKKIAGVVTQTSALHEGEQAKKRNVPIPKGFVVSQIEGTKPENTIAGGLVIYQTGDVNTTVDGFWTNIDDDGYLTCQTSYNQYVWIPVDDINSMVMCKSNGKAIKADGTETEEGKTVCSLVQGADGKLTCTTHNSTDLAGRLYTTYTDNSKLNGIYTQKLDFANTEQEYNTDSGYREPANLKDKNYGDATEQGITAITSILQAENKTYEGTVTYDTIKADWLKLQQDDFDTMAESVARYGGFYISRYEVGEGGTSKKNKDALRNDWWSLYSTLRTSRTSMMWGSQYDQVIKFIGEPAQVGHSDRNLGKNSASKSGLNELDFMNNIYDLEGNYRDITAEANESGGRTRRSGVYEAAAGGTFQPSSYRSTGSPSSLHVTRSTLYL